MGNRKIQDAGKSEIVALPAAGASANTPAIDLGFNPGKDENVELEIVVDATDNLADTKDIDVTLESSSDGTTFAAVPEFSDPIIKVTSSGGGSSETSIALRMPSSINRYVRASGAVEASGGDVTDNYLRIRQLF